jgi:tetratricopeptide (TPR) repeat protein
MRTRIAAFIAILLLGIAFTVSAQPSKDHPSLVRLLRWLEVVELHSPGSHDSAVVEVGSWASNDLYLIPRQLERISTFLEAARELSARDPLGFQQARAAVAAGHEDPRAGIELYDRFFRIDRIEQIFHGNQTLKRGAVLHADIGVFVNDDPSEKAAQVYDESLRRHLIRMHLFVDERRAAHLVEDGRSVGIRQGSLHWRIGGQLLDLIKPNRGDAAALLWYRAVSAYLFREGRLSELPDHLEKAKEIFPTESFPFLDSAYLHQMYASPAIQAAVQDLRPNNSSAPKSRWLVGSPVDSRTRELNRAEQFLRDALARAPDHAEVRIRLGQTLGELGRHKEAAADLRAVPRRGLTRQFAYLVELFHGREEHALGRRAEAERHYENAAALYPTAQSPRLALSYLARQSGNRAAAARYLEEIVRRPPGSNVDETDPWWFYYEPHKEDADALMHRMRQIGTIDLP